MTTFDDRKSAFENKFKHDQELQFKVNARRNKLVGLWAAEKLGKTGAAAEAYADSLVVAEVAADSDARVFEQVRKDFAAAGVDQSDHQIRRTMDELLAKVAELNATVERYQHQVLDQHEEIARLREAICEVYSMSDGMIQPQGDGRFVTVTVEWKAWKAFCEIAREGK